MNINDLQDAKLTAKTEYARFKDKFQAEWSKPEIDMLKARMWKEMSPLVKLELAKRIQKR